MRQEAVGGCKDGGCKSRLCQGLRIFVSFFIYSPILLLHDII